MFQLNTWIEKGITILIILVVGWIVSRFVKSLILRLTGKSPDQGAVTFLASATSLLIKIMVIVMILEQLGVNSNVIVGAFSACTLGISLALRSNMADVAGGMQIIFTKPFQVGDFVKVLDHEGTIQRIEIMYTVMETISHTEVIIPNSKLVENTITNYSKEGKVFIHIPMTLSAGVDMENVQATFYHVLREDPDVIQTEDMDVQIDSLESGFQLGVYCAVYSHRYPKAEANLKKKLQEARIKAQINLPSQTVVVHGQVN
ncbi:MAG: mechanosensitive ion channel [Absicoccus sp.]|uniref:Mechanosensitive ion channel family protein n=1 Tax=Absicoccus intestinalis TaxID=2926319 RepID=A0ABU4WNX2_9FIRM|nr:MULTISPECIES: mechanosensitive ion channel domain-containing protein [unclassified Absicoccus]MDX8418263.1 mechanosensitive ion channel family protein [Absicoccus sp. CLA-KB-P134]MDY3034707.1 mechanosensitive ion channel [Absicoccus sp.]